MTGNCAAGMVLRLETPVAQASPRGWTTSEFLTLLGTAIGVKGAEIGQGCLSPACRRHGGC